MTATDTQAPDWGHKDEWYKHGHHCTVLVSRHVSYSNKNAWCVYAIVLKGHWLFESLLVDKPYYDIGAVNDLPLHGGCTYFQHQLHHEDGDGMYWRTYKKGEVWGVKVGCYYSHFGDDRFEEAHDRESAQTVFHDADRLLAYLEGAASDE